MISHKCPLSIVAVAMSIAVIMAACGTGTTPTGSTAPTGSVSPT